MTVRSKKQDRSGSGVSVLSDLKPNERNPRRISNERLEMLKASVREFGDLSGYVFNRRSGRLIAGHQRERVMPKDSTIDIVKTHSKPTKLGTVREGYVQVNGERFSYREVDWPRKKEIAAMVAANKHGGTWENDPLMSLLGESNEAERLLAGFTPMEYENILGSKADSQVVQFRAKASDNDYSKFEIMLKNANKDRLASLLSRIKDRHSVVSQEDALMILLQDYEKIGDLKS